MKNLLLSLLILFTITLTPISKSHAAIGALSGASQLVYTGGYLLDYSIPITILLSSAGDGAGYAGVLFGFIGIVLLDTDNNLPSFSEIDNKEALQIGLTSEEQIVFNENIEETNMVIHDFLITATSEKLSKADAEMLWDEYNTYLPVEVQTSLKKIDKLAKK